MKEQPIYTEADMRNALANADAVMRDQMRVRAVIQGDRMLLIEAVTWTREGVWIRVVDSVSVPLS